MVQNSHINVGLWIEILGTWVFHYDNLNFTPGNLKKVANYWKYSG